MGNKLKKAVKIINYLILAVVLAIFAIARIPFGNKDHIKLSSDERDLFFPKVEADSGGDSGDSGDSDDGGDGGDGK